MPRRAAMWLERPTLPRRDRMADILIPKLGMSMTDATLSEWLVADGAEIKVGQDIYAIETHKSVQEVQSTVAGRLVIIAKAGEVYPVGALIARVE
jgi:pyruvate/2-oxoglutarate dehydrogenase complex dihydrolipoamide acyltransferase (E2) component